MKLSTGTVAQPASQLVSRQLAERPATNEAAAVKHAVAANRPQVLPDDIVTLSTSQKDSPPKMKASQPVNSEEKQALLQPPGSPWGGFSVYG
ncbi:hypothetical protein F6V25_12030 [Oryzomonas japonica]|uniref:Uncharacterized protein n=1 Tax=Oryzomonas japonica TaxID=2603858 RepID=A0A7J4ZPF1_9BACT|nr:hypothetical protein [Oryzomonas japonica]KAB0664784.1 hypothetical protein F6V25_12030 [Oryzomonas japonica]